MQKVRFLGDGPYIYYHPFENVYGVKCGIVNGFFKSSSGTGEISAFWIRKMCACECECGGEEMLSIYLFKIRVILNPSSL